MSKSLKGYIIMGCFGRFFSKEESSYNCELCGHHWTEAKIDGFDSLKDYALSESVGELFYSDTIDKKDFDIEYKEHKEWLMSTYETIMNEVLDDYSISYDDFYKIAFEYWDNKIKIKT